MSKKIDPEKQEALDKLRKWLKPGTMVYTILRHCSSSGMSRRISLVIVDKDRTIFDITGYAGRVLDYRRHKDGGLVVGGCGMDMGFHLVYHLGSVLFPNGGPLKAAPRGRQLQGRARRRGARDRRRLPAQARVAVKVSQ